MDEGFAQDIFANDNHGSGSSSDVAILESVLIGSKNGGEHVSLLNANDIAQSRISSSISFSCIASTPSAIDDANRCHGISPNVLMMSPP